MRLYYGFVTATTMMVGLCYWHRFGCRDDASLFFWIVDDAALIMMAFFAWGFNQIFSDWYDRKEDAINAPHRPMVTGALAPRPAFALSVAGLASIAVAGFFMSPWTLAFLALGGTLNIAYSFLKCIPALNCFAYAAAVSCCALFAIAGMARRCPTFYELEFVAECILPVHFLMCHNSYYKDVKGDRAAGVRTLQTLSPGIAKAISVFMAGGVVVLLLLSPALNLYNIALAALIALFAGAFQLAVSCSRFHRATCLNCQLCVLMLHAQFFAATWPYAIASLVVIQLLFLWYTDEKE